MLERTPYCPSSPTFWIGPTKGKAVENTHLSRHSEGPVPKDQSEDMSVCFA